MEQDAKIYVAGHRGMAGSAVVRKLSEEGHANLLLRTRAELDLTRQKETAEFFERERPEYVFLCAARVGGIHANNTYRAEFLYENLAIQNNVIHSAHLCGAKKLLFLGSSCIYPKLAPQPMKENCLLSGPLEHTNEPYALAKIAGVKMCQAYRDQYGSDFVSAMPTNLYGPGDDYDPDNSHVMAALIRKFAEAVHHGKKSVRVWGSGAPKREFLHVDDLADALLFLMREYGDREIINVGSGSEISIRALADLLKKISGFQGEVEWDDSKPDGTPRKLMDSGRIEAMDWKAKTDLREGVKKTFQNYLANLEKNGGGKI